MKCRCLFKDENRNNYNLVFFKSKGQQLPYAIEIQLDKDLKIIECKKNSSGSIGDVLSYNYIYNDKKSCLELSFVNSTEVEKVFNFYVLKEVNSQKILFETIVLKAKENSFITFPFKKFAISIPTDKNYAGLQEGVAYSLTQSLSVLKGELWWQINHGLPLLEKIKNKNILDSVIINIILKNPDVVNIFYLNSSVKGDQYYFETKIATIYADDIYLSNTISG